MVRLALTPKQALALALELADAKARADAIEVRERGDLRRKLARRGTVIQLQHIVVKALAVNPTN